MFDKYLKEALNINAINEDYYIESGLRDIKELAKKYKNAVIYFHEDLDGVTSAIGLKEYLKKYGIQTIEVHQIQYGSQEYAIPKSSDNVLNVLVDFAHGKYMMHIHTDHHESQIGAGQTKATSFVKAPSNADFISTVLNPQDVFPQDDIKLISIVDSADYAKNDIPIERVINGLFELDKNKPLKINKENQGFVVNKLLLSYKNKKGFLEQIVMRSKPSLHSMYLEILKFIKEANITMPGNLIGDKKSTEEWSNQYEMVQRGKRYNLGKRDVKYILQLGEIKYFQEKRHGKFIKEVISQEINNQGQHMVVGNLLIQYGSSPLWGHKKFDRYMAFKINPDVDYFCMIWPFGMIQVSKNPFKKGINPVSLGDLILGKGEGITRSGGIMDKFKSELENIKVTLDDIKYNLESDIKTEEHPEIEGKDIENLKNSLLEMGYQSKSKSVGFTADDFANVFKGCRIEGLQKDPEWKKMMRTITNTKYHNLVETRSSKSFYDKKKVTELIKRLSVKEVYPQATEEIVGGDPNKVLATDMLKKVSVPLWDIVMINSGGHKDITNISSLNFCGSGLNILRRIAFEIAEKMKDMKLVDNTQIEESFNELKNEFV